MRYASVLVAVISALFIRAFLISVYKVPSQSMAPTILAGDFILASQTAYGVKLPGSSDTYFVSTPQKGDLVAYIKDSRIFIKRVIALAGDEISYLDGQYTINSTNCAQSTVTTTESEKFGIFIENCGEKSWQIVRFLDLKKNLKMDKFTVLPGNIFVVSDNRDSDISPNFAENISADQIIGKPLFIWMSFSSTQDFISKDTGIRWNRILTKL